MRSRVLLLPIVGTTLVVGCLVAFIYTQVADTLRVDERGILRGLVGQVGEEIASTAKSLTASAEMAAHLPQMRVAVAALAKDQVVGLLAEGYGVLQRKYGFAVGQINSTNRTVLHRLHEPASSGDDFTSNRKIIVAVHATNQPQSGVEIGSSGVRVRGAAPVEADGKVVGSVEFGMELGAMLEELKARTNADFAVVIDRRLLSVRPGTPESNVFGHLRGDSATSWPLVARMHELGMLSLVKEPVYAFHTLNGVSYGTATVPLLDYSGSEIGIVVAAKSFGADARSMNRLAVALVAAGFAAEFGIILILYRGMVLRPVAAVIAAMNGMVSPPTVDLPKPGSVSEVNGLIAAAERVRTILSAKRDAP